MKKLVYLFLLIFAGKPAGAQISDTLALLFTHLNSKANVDEINKILPLVKVYGSDAARLQWGVYLYNQNKTDSAISIWQNCKTNEIQCMLLAKALYKTGQEKQAFAVLQENIFASGQPYKHQILKDSVFLVHRNEAQFMNLVNSLEYPQWAQKMGDADFQLQLKKNNLAERYLNENLEKFPAKKENWYLLGLVYLNQKDTSNALRYIEKTEIQKLDANGGLMFSQLLYKTGKSKEAYTQASYFLKKYPHITDIYKVFIMSGIENKEKMLASDIRTASIIFADDAEVLSSLAKYFLQEDDALAALKYLSAAIAQQPWNAELLVARAVIYANGQSWKLAERDLQQSIDHKPRNPQAYTLLGNVKYEMEDYANACNAWRMAATLGSDEAQKKLVKYCKTKSGL